MKKTLITDVAKMVMAQASLAEIRAKIQQFIDDNNLETTVELWVLDHVEVLRRWAFPSYWDFIDAYVKIHSGDEQLASQGQTQMQDFIDRYLTIRTKFQNNT